MRAARATTGSKNRSGTHSTADCSLEEHVAGSPVRTMDAGLTVRHTGAHVRLEKMRGFVKNNLY